MNKPIKQPIQLLQAIIKEKWVIPKYITPFHTKTVKLSQTDCEAIT